MPRTVPADYFATGAFAPAGPELFHTYTCLGCGLRSATWSAFRAHRGVCSGRLWATLPQYGPSLWQHLGALADSARPAPDERQPSLDVPAALQERDPFLDAPPAALQALERWWRAQETSPAGTGAPESAPPEGAQEVAAAAAAA